MNIKAKLVMGPLKGNIIIKDFVEEIYITVPPRVSVGSGNAQPIKNLIFRYLHAENQNTHVYGFVGIE